MLSDYMMKITQQSYIAFFLILFYFLGKTSTGIFLFNDKNANG